MIESLSKYFGFLASENQVNREVDSVMYADQWIAIANRIARTGPSLFTVLPYPKSSLPLALL